ncbi:MAG: NADH dehydrogenase (quinone) subunit D [Thermoflexales bacterium]|nr:NADH dehydrogenase (quinone) subunit D [Thermoflexales bacterium]MBP8242084.1 NADH dehydrogenase (quinone) subunit D [Thermoflexales bacterium]
MMNQTQLSVEESAHNLEKTADVQLDITVEQLKKLVSPRAFTGETMLLNMGPQHPSTHGVLRLLLELDGETVVSCIPDIGFLHTGIEKTHEGKTYLKGLPLTDRTDYLAPMINNLAYCGAIEKLCGIDVPLRAQYLRVILSELTRMNSHLVWLGTHALDIGAMSVFLYCMRERELLLDVFESVSGARMMSSYFRPGGLWRDVPDVFFELVRKVMDVFPGRIIEYERLLKENPIWRERTVGIGVIGKADAIAWGMTGPSLRGSGVNYDIRKAFPYSSYDHFDFSVPLGTRGDVYDRYRCRLDEFTQSLKIIKQALDRLPPGPVITDDRKFSPPPKHEIAYSMESLIHHFKLWTEGFHGPNADVYFAVESGKGEYGVYIHGDGGPKPRRVHFRAPSLCNLQALPQMSDGALIADLVGIIGSVDIVLGEVDR